MKKTVLIATLFSLFSAMPASAGVSNGAKLGSVQLTDAKDKDVVVLPPCKVSSNRKVKKLAVKVTRFSAEIDSLKVVYQNGDKQTLNVKDHFAPNSTSRWIDLNGDARCISKIVVKGDTNTRFFRPGKQAKVTFFGR